MSQRYNNNTIEQRDVHREMPPAHNNRPPINWERHTNQQHSQQKSVLPDLLPPQHHVMPAERDVSFYNYCF